MRIARLFGLPTLALLSACQVQNQPLPSEATCASGGRSYGSLRSAGGALCDNQHLVASLNPFTVDAAAGKGALDVPLRVTKTESRDYCFVDDNGEDHKLVIRDASGRELVRLKAGDPCVRATLETGTYTARIEHERPGEVDATPDVVHSRLVAREGVQSLMFEVNACPGCQLTGVEELPCWGQNPFFDEPAYCGLRGDYHGATIHAICDQAAGDRPFTDDPYDVICSFSGDFSGANLDIRFGFLGRDGSHVELGAPDRTTTFGRADLSQFNMIVGTDVWIRNVSSFSGQAPDLRRAHVDNDSPGTLVDRGYVRAFNQAESFNGKPFIHRSSTLSFSGELLDYSRVLVYPQPRGFTSLEGANFQRATIRNMPPLREAGQDLSYRSANFNEATIENSVLDATILDGANFNGTQFHNVTFPRARGQRVSANSAHFVGATLDHVTFGEEHDANLASTVDFDLSQAEFNGSVASALAFHNATFDGATFTGATIGTLTARHSNLANVELDVASLRNLDISYSVLAGTVRIGGGSVRQLDSLTAFGAVIRTPFAGWTFNNPSLRGATLEADFANARFVDADLTRTTFDCPKNNAGACDVARGSYNGMRFSGATNMTSTMVLWSMKDAFFDGVTLTSAIFVAPLGATTFNRGIVGGARFCDAGDPQSYAGLTFTSVNMTGLVMPVQGSAYPSGPTTDFVCRGGISAASRDGLRTAAALRCPSGQLPASGDCKGAEWTPLAEQVPAACCDPRDPNCDQLNSRQRCVANCQCASEVCLANQTCQ